MPDITDCLAMMQNVINLSCLEPCVNRHRYDPRFIEAQVAQSQFGNIWQVQSDTVACSHAGGQQTSRQIIRHLLELRIGSRFVPKNDGRLFRKALDRFPQLGNN